MIKQVTAALIAFALCGSAKAVGAPIVIASAHERAAALTRAQAQIKQNAKPRRRVARQPAPSGGSSTKLPSGDSSFDLKKIWESD
jgi:hypothetical protein